jgi:DNA topoisomerase-2
MFPEFTPWYRGFIGEIEKNGENRFVSYGIVEEGKKGTIEVKELPVSMATEKFAEFCEDLKADKKIKSVSNYSSTKNVHFVITEDKDNFQCDLDTLKLHSYLYTSNMVMFNEKIQIKKHDTVDSILDTFCAVRFGYYEKRKRHQLDALEKEIRYLGNKERFVSEVVSKTISFMNEEESEIIKTLTDRGYDQDPKKNEGEGGYDYLLRMQVRTFTADKIKELNNDIASLKEKLEGLRAKSEKDIWIEELNQFENAYRRWLQEIEQEEAVAKKRRLTKNKK